MPNNPNFPHFDYFEVEFTKDGEIAQRQQVDDLIHFLHATGTTTDLFVISHGWNNDMNDARQLYVNFFGILKTQLGTSKFANLNQRKFTVLGVLWPSKKFADQDLIPGNATGDAGGAAGVGSTADVGQDDLLQKLDLFQDALGDPSAAPQFAEARSVVPELANFPSKQRRFVDLIRSVLPQTSEAVTVEDASPAFFKLDAQDLINRLSRPMPAELAQTSRSAAGLQTGKGSAPWLGDVLSGIKGSFIHLLDYTTYYVMNDLARTVGRTGVYQVLREVRDDCPSL